MGMGFVRVWASGEKERRREKKNKKMFFSPASAFAREEEAAQCRSKRHGVMFHSFLPSFFLVGKK
jgi:hypothetical protein